MIRLQFHKTLSFGRTEIKAGTLLAIFLHTSLLCKTFFFLSPFLFSLNISWLVITDAESWQKEQKKACLEGDTGLAQQAFSLQNRLAAYIPINYTTLISEITNIPRNSRRQTEMGGGGIGAICSDRLFLLATLWLQESPKKRWEKQWEAAANAHVRLHRRDRSQSPGRSPLSAWQPIASPKQENITKSSVSVQCWDVN